MTHLPAEQVARLGAYVVPAILWVVVAAHMWSHLRDSVRPTTHRRLLFAAAVAMALHQIGSVLIPLLPDGDPPTWLRVFGACTEAALVMAVACFAHMVVASASPAGAASRRWLAIDYGSALAVAVIVGVLGQSRAGMLVLAGYIFVLLAVTAWSGSRRLHGGWWFRSSVDGLQRPDLVVLSGAVLCVGAWLGFAVACGKARLDVGIDTAIPLLVAVPFVARMLGAVVRSFLLVGLLLAATGLVYLTAASLRAGLEPWQQTAVDLGAVGLLVALMIPGQAWLRAGLDHVLFRRTYRRGHELQAAVHELSPELGREACCRRLAEAVVGVMRVRAAAVLLDDGRTAIAHGPLVLGPLKAVWPSATGGETLPAQTIAKGDYDVLAPALQDALCDASIIAIVPIASPRSRRGHLVIAAGPIAASLASEDVQAIESVARQLALLLDGCELLERAVAVERSLAHAEKLAAMGELSARVAHDIRNPLTAARSLAQQISREPNDFGEELGIILSELERVERHVATLLRYVRREDFQFAPVDVGAVVRGALEPYRRRCADAGIVLRSDLEAGITARADEEKLRQVVSNLVENALDAMAASNGAGRSLAVALAASNGTATLRVTDSGPGVAPDLLPQLFEPFFSQKSTGTGLGLAIAKRTIEAHGGRIAAHCADGAGLTFEVVLPRGT